MIGLVVLLSSLALIFRSESDLEHLVAAVCGATIVSLSTRAVGDP